MKSIRLIKNKKGFTLLEVIVTMIVAAILGTMLVTLMGNGVTDSVTPLLRVQNANTLGQVVENITADYAKLNSDDVGNSTTIALSTLHTNITNGNVSTSTPYYGPYTIVYLSYISFDGSGNQVLNGAPNSYRVLKVSLRQGEQTITTLFTK